MRHILYLAALVAVAKNEDFRALYRGLTTR
ncbi:MAG TPA: hypothetical protein GXX40_03805 [Firmicutes bacterium]|nr:hypothetical protein [Bacillota bacterium]